MIRYKTAFAFCFLAACLMAQVRDGKHVSLLASVTDSRGRFIDGLAQQDFELREDGKDQVISQFITFRNTPSSVGVLVDTSASMKTRLTDATNAIDDFVEDLHKNDELFLMPFADQPSSATLTGAIRAIRDSVVLVYCLGVPAPFGPAFRQSSNNFAGQIVVTQPGRSPQNPFPMPDGRTIPVPIPGRPDSVPVPLPSRSDRVEDTLDMDTLQALADAGAGRAWRVRDRQGRGEALDRILAQIRSELRSQYAIGFTPDHPLRDNRWHSVTIRIKDFDYSVRSRKEYLGK